MATILKVECECGQLARVNEIGSGSISTSCPNCKAQRFYKSPAAVAAFKKKYSTDATAAPAAENSPEPQAARGLLDEFK